MYKVTYTNITSIGSVLLRNIIKLPDSLYRPLWRTLSQAAWKQINVRKLIQCTVQFYVLFWSIARYFQSQYTFIICFPIETKENWWDILFWAICTWLSLFFFSSQNWYNANCNVACIFKRRKKKIFLETL